MGTTEGPFFEVNQRFKVDRSSNTIYDRKRSTRYRLEPRLMRLLCLLADNGGEVVSREAIIKEIWDDYPGADDGLNQGISHLRKVLEDENRSIIRTVPKIGYVFDGLTPVQPAAQEIITSVQPARKNRWGYIVVFLLFCVICFIAWMFLARNRSNERITDDRRISAIDEARQYFKEDQKQAEDSLVMVRVQLLKFANLHIRDINNKATEDSMEYWNQAQTRLMDRAAAAKFSLDSLRNKLKP